MSRLFTPGAFFQMFGFEHSITRVDVKCLCENRQILQCCLKGFIGPSFRACSLIKFSKKQKKSTLAAKFCHINGLYLGGMDPEQLVCVLLSVFGEKFPRKCLFSIYLGSKIFRSSNQLSQCRLSEFLLL